MDKMGYPRGLIRYSSENALIGKTSEQTTAFGKVIAPLLRPRIAIYTAILASVTVGFVASLYLRVPLKVSVQRDRATLVRDAGTVASRTFTACKLRMQWNGRAALRLAQPDCRILKLCSTPAMFGSRLRSLQHQRVHCRCVCAPSREAYQPARTTFAFM